ncbi:MAG: dipeptidase PepV [Peptostreptococcaceae bacterium]|nr:dipeptidase PepV [Peptostreptococcaceae bacterium]
MEYLKLIEEYKDEMIKTLQELISIKSVAEPALNDSEDGFLPFGKGVHESFKYMLEKASADGFDIENVDNYGGHIEFGGYLLDEAGEIIGTNAEVVGILAHLDVVPEGSDWKYDPFAGEIADGKMFGRGASDNKGPLVASYYAMKALKDSGIIPEKKVRLILGLDEETDWDGMKHYFSKEKSPDLGFTPDADFPVIHGEKGILVFELAKKIGKTTNKGLELRTVTGGNAANMVADSARAILRGDNYDSIREIVATYKAETGYKINVKGMGKSLEITSHGISSHGARPEKGLNAISIMMELLGKLPIVNEDMIDFVEFYNKHIGFELDGTKIGCGISDEVSGNLIFNVGKINVDSEAGRLVINVRYPVTAKEEDVYSSIMPILNLHNFGIIRLKNQAPIYFPEDYPMVEILMDIYREQTGDLNSKPVIIGGGTYARATDNIVAFGATFPGEEEVAHQKNEYISIDNLMRAAKIYAEAIYKLSQNS